MPLVFSTNEATESGHQYDDRTGESYEYPAARYRRLVQAGERFVYYRGRRTISGRNQPQVYLGVGVVGPIAQAVQDPARLTCRVLDYRPFPAPVAFKDDDGRHLEPGGDRGGFYYQPGVRRISEQVFDQILGRGFDQEFAAEEGPASARRHRYASPEVREAVDVFAMQQASRAIASLYPDQEVTVQNHSNPGFDIRVGPVEQPLRFVEVKGTQAPIPRFFLTEGERVFSHSTADRYTLIVIYSIDLEKGGYLLASRDGAIRQQECDLQPVQWSGCIPSPEPD